MSVNTRASQSTMGSTTPAKDKDHQRFSSFTSRNPDWAYMHLHLISSSASLPSLDLITARKYLTDALTQYLGLAGASLPIDILKIIPAANHLYIRVHRSDAAAVSAALASWIGNSSREVESMSFRVLRTSSYLPVLNAGNIKGLFADGNNEVPLEDWT